MLQLALKRVLGKSLTDQLIRALRSVNIPLKNSGLIVYGPQLQHVSLLVLYGRTKFGFAPKTHAASGRN
jgi:hypothetical protein